jgi:hypothetical protein
MLGFVLGFFLGMGCFLIIKFLSFSWEIKRFCLVINLKF